MKYGQSVLTCNLEFISCYYMRLTKFCRIAEDGSFAKSRIISPAIALVTEMVRFVNSYLTFLYTSCCSKF